MNKADMWQVYYVMSSTFHALHWWRVSALSSWSRSKESTSWEMYDCFLKEKTHSKCLNSTDTSAQNSYCSRCCVHMHHHALCFTVKHTSHCHALCFTVKHTSPCTVLLSNIHYITMPCVLLSCIIMHCFVIQHTSWCTVLLSTKHYITMQCFSTEHTQSHPTQHTPTITVCNIHFHTNAALNCTIITTDYLRHPIS